MPKTPVQIVNADTGALVLMARRVDRAALVTDARRVAAALADEWGAPMQVRMWSGEAWEPIGGPVVPLAQAHIWLN